MARTERLVSVAVPATGRRCERYAPTRRRLRYESGHLLYLYAPRPRLPDPAGSVAYRRLGRSGPAVDSEDQVGMRLVPWQPDDLVRRLNDVVAVYGEAMGYRTELLEARRGYLASHARRPGFRAVAALTTEGHLVGFGYGYTSAAGQWWHDQVYRAMDEQARKAWFADCFEVVELHVRPAAQGHGVGGRQLRALLSMADGSTTLLSTPEADEQRSRAWRLYRRFGFVDVLRDFRFPGDERPFAVLGRQLPLTLPRIAAQPG